MSSRYWQVAQTYLRRWFVWAMMGALALFSWMVHYQKSYPRRDNSGLLREMALPCVMIYIILATSFAGFVTAHLKEQMAQWRARLTPKYRAPHVIVAGIA